MLVCPTRTPTFGALHPLRAGKGTSGSPCRFSTARKYTPWKVGPRRAVDTDKEASPAAGRVKPGTTLKPRQASQEGPASVMGLMQRLKNVKILGLDFSSELIAISLVYFIQGILGLSRLAVAFFFKDEFGLDPAELGLITGLAGLPWVIKPLYGFISDSVPLWGYHRRSYLVLSGLTGFAAWGCMSYLVHSPTTAVLAMGFTALSTASSDVLIDGLVVERARDAPQAVSGSLQSLCWGSQAAGGVISAYWSGYLVDHFGTRFVFGLTALFPLFVSASALLINEQRITKSSRNAHASPPPEPASFTSKGTLTAESAPLLPVTSATNLARRPHSRSGSQEQIGADSSTGGGVGIDTATTSRDTSNDGTPATGPPAITGTVRQQFMTRLRMLWSAVSKKEILLPAAFVFVWQSTPSSESAMFYFQTKELNFTPEFLGRVKLISSLASLAGVTLYNTALKKVPIRTMLWGAMLIGTTLGSTQLILVSRLNLKLGLSDQLFVLGDQALLTALGQATFMPLLVLAARLCPQGVEATLFATLMSVFNAGAFSGSALGAGLTKALGVTADDFSNLFTLVLLCNLGQLLPAPFLHLIPDALDKPEDDDDQDGDGGLESQVLLPIKPPAHTPLQASPKDGHVLDIELQPGSGAAALVWGADQQQGVLQPHTLTGSYLRHPVGQDDSTGSGHFKDR